MVTSIKLTGKYNIGISGAGQINVAGTNVALRDIPFVRYDLNEYNVEEVEYIKKMMEQFKLSTHLIQYRVSTNLLSDLANTNELTGKVAKYLYFVIEQEDMLNGTLKTEDLQIAHSALSTYSFDRIMIIDKTQNMDMANAKKIMASTAKYLGVKADNIGLCSSPLCLNQQLACLTALKARELATIYNANTDVALPSANHQCMNTCGCMRFFTITSDVEAPIDNKTKKESQKNNKEKTDSDTKQKATKKVKQTHTFTINNFV